MERIVLKQVNKGVPKSFTWKLKYWGIAFIDLRTQTGGIGPLAQCCTSGAGQMSSRLEQEMGFKSFELIRALDTAFLSSQRVTW
jgi:hypothetical protein